MLNRLFYILPLLLLTMLIMACTTVDLEEEAPSNILIDDSQETTETSSLPLTEGTTNDVNEEPTPTLVTPIESDPIPVASDPVTETAIVATTIPATNSTDVEAVAPDAVENFPTAEVPQNNVQPETVIVTKVVEVIVTPTPTIIPELVNNNDQQWKPTPVPTWNTNSNSTDNTWNSGDGESKVWNETTNSYETDNGTWNSESDNVTEQPTKSYPTPTPWPTAVPPIIHIIAPGETVAIIATNYNVSIDAIVRANNLYSEHIITAGDALKIPNSENDSYSVAGQPDLTTEQLEQAYDEQTGGFDPNNHFFHTVGTGQTLYSIGAYYGFTVEELAAYNNLSDATQIAAGSAIRIPIR